MNFKRFSSVVLAEVRRVTDEAAAGLAQCGEGDLARLEALSDSEHPGVAATARMALDLLEQAGQDPIPDPIPDEEHEC